MKTKITGLFSIVLLAALNGRSTGDARPKLILQVGGTDRESVVGFVHGGRDMITCGGDGVRIYRMSNRALIDFRPIKGASYLNGVLSQDGRRLLLSVGHMRRDMSQVPEMRLMDVETGRVLASRMMASWPNGMETPLFLSGRPALVDNESRGYVYIWPMHGPPVRLARKGDPIRDPFPVAQDGDDGLIVTQVLKGSAPAVLRFWKPYKSRPVIKRTVAGIKPWFIVVHPTEPVIAILDDRGSMFELNRRTWKVVRLRGCQLKRVNWITYTPDGRNLAIEGSAEVNGASCFEIVDRSSGARLARFPNSPSEYLQGFAITPDGKRFVTSRHSDGERLWIYSLPEGMPLGAFPRQPTSPGFLSCSTDARTLASSAGDRGIGIWDLPHAHLRDTIPTDGNYYSFPRVSPDGRFVVCANNSPWAATAAYDIANRLVAWKSQAGPDTGCGPAFPPDSKTVVVPAEVKLTHGFAPIEPGPQARMVELATGRLIKQIGSINVKYTGRAAAEFTPSGRHLVITGPGVPIRVYDGKAFALLREIPIPETSFNHVPGPFRVILSDDNVALYTGDDSGLALGVWNIHTGKRLWHRTWKSGPIRVLYGDRGLKHLVLYGINGEQTGEVYRAADGQPLKTDMRIVRRAVDLSTGSNQRLGIVPGKDGSITFRDNDTGDTIVSAFILPFGKPDRPAEWIAYTPDGYYQGSPGVERRFVWRVGSRVLPGNALVKRFNRPDVIERRIGVKLGRNAATAADAAHH